MSNRKKPLPTSVIERASNDDSEAMREVINHYSGYIRSLATVRVFDEYGNRYLIIDETLRSELEICLITKVIGLKSTA